MSKSCASCIYVASRASIPARSAMWRNMRAEGWPIVSSWIDEAGEGETKDTTDLWARIHAEISSAVGLVFYAEPDDFPLKGAFVEVGIAIGLGKRIVVCLPGIKVSGMNCRPVGSWINHPFVRRYDDVKGACSMAQGLWSASTGTAA